jgi:hypothetical protein
MVDVCSVNISLTSGKGHLATHSYNSADNLTTMITHAIIVKVGEVASYGLPEQVQGDKYLGRKDSTPT